MKVLYGADGSDLAERAAGLLARVADRERVEITVASVTHAGTPELEYAPLMLDPIEVRRKDTLALVDHWVEWFRNEGFPATGRVAEGKPGDELVKLIENDWYDLSVLGSGRRTWLGRRLLGSVSTHLLHSSPSSVLVVHDVFPADGDPRVLMAVDGSRSCEFAARAVRGLTPPDSTKVRVISCFEPGMPFAMPGAATVISMTSGDLYERAMEAAGHHAERIAGEFRDDGYEAAAQAVEGHPLEHILTEAKAFQADLVVVGSRGLGGVGRALLGSVSDQVARHAPATLVGRRAIDKED